jgi:hypothetical protein
VFDGTIFMNATVMEHDIIKCSTPPVLNSHGINEKNIKHYDVWITLNNKDLTGTGIRFYYHKEVQIKSVTPPGGPVKGNTTTVIAGKGFNPTCCCNMTVRFSTYQVIPDTWNDTHIIVNSPQVNIPDDVVVAVGINGQQFNPDIKLNNKDIENTFTYYDMPIVTSYYPENGPSSGGTLIKVTGHGFHPWTKDRKEKLLAPVYIRMREWKKDGKLKVNL